MNFFTDLALDKICFGVGRWRVLECIIISFWFPWFVHIVEIRMTRDERGMMELGSRLSIADRMGIRPIDWRMRDGASSVDWSSCPSDCDSWSSYGYPCWSPYRDVHWDAYLDVRPFLDRYGGMCSSDRDAYWTCCGGECCLTAIDPSEWSMKGLGLRVWAHSLCHGAGHSVMDRNWVHLVLRALTVPPACLDTDCPYSAPVAS